MQHPCQTDELCTHRGTPAVQRMVEYAPSSGGLALWMHHRDCDLLPGTAPDPGPAPKSGAWGYDPEPLTCANDGTTIYYLPVFADLPLARQTGLVAHQVLHVALRHAQRHTALVRQRGDVDPVLFNCCADAIVNSTLSHLGWLELAPTAVRLERLLSQVLGIERGASSALLEWDVERLYRAIDDRRLDLASRGRNGRTPRPSLSGDGTGRGATHADPMGGDDGAAAGEDGPRAAQVRALARLQPRDLLPAPAAGHPEQEAELAREWHERLVRGHAGDGVHSLLRQLLADLPKLRVPWEQVLRTLLARGLSRQPALSWSRPARSWLANGGRAPNGRRLPWTPGITASRAVARLVVIVDCSGSIEDGLLGRFATEVEAISRRLEAPLTLIVGDDRVRAVTSHEPGRSSLRDIAFHGGGGTDFGPLLREAEDFAPDICVVLTDLDGPAGYRPRWPVIWAVPRPDAERPVPFGRLLVLE